MFICINYGCFVFYLLLDYDWKWDLEIFLLLVCFIRGNKEVLFYFDYSCGIVVVKGFQLLIQGSEYYWEIKMISVVYGIDMVCREVFCLGYLIVIVIIDLYVFFGINTFCEQVEDFYKIL